MLRMQRSRRMHSRRHRRTSAVCRAALREMRMRSIRKTLFDSEALSLPVLKPAQINLFAAQSGTGLEDLLGAFGYIGLHGFYNEQDGTVRVPR